MTKHAAIYPVEEELQAIQKIVSITERALKLVSDIITDQDNKTKEDEKNDAQRDRYTGAKYVFSFYTYNITVCVTSLLRSYEYLAHLPR